MSQRYTFNGEHDEFVVLNDPERLSITIQSKARGYDDYHMSQASGRIVNADERIAFALAVTPPGYVMIRQEDLDRVQSRKK